MAEIFNIIQFSTNYLVHQGHCWLLGWVPVEPTEWIELVHTLHFLSAIEENCKGCLLLKALQPAVDVFQWIHLFSWHCVHLMAPEKLPHCNKVNTMQSEQLYMKCISSCPPLHFNCIHIPHCICILYPHYIKCTFYSVPVLKEMYKGCWLLNTFNEYKLMLRMHFSTYLHQIISPWQERILGVKSSKSILGDNLLGLG